MPGPYYSHKPRQPRSAHHRQFRASARNRPPLRVPPGIKFTPQTKAAVQIQRAFRKTRYVPKKPLAVGTEVYQIRTVPQNENISQNAASVLLGPKNSSIIMPTFFNSASDVVDNNGFAYKISGSFIKPVYGWKTKLRISFKDIAHHADNKGGLLLRVHHGVMKVSPDKFNASIVSRADFAAACLVHLRQELYNSEVSSNFLDFAQKNRNIKVNGSWVVKPNRNNMIRMDESIGPATMQSFNAPPPKCYTVNHPIPPNKTRCTFVDDSTPLPTQLWVPWLLIGCDQMSSNSGHFLCEYSSRMYFTDN